MFNSVFGGSAINQAKPTLLQLNPLSASTTLSWPVIAAPSTNVVADMIEVTPSTSGLSIGMPDATLGSTGVAAIFNNLSGLYAFVVADFSGNTIATVSPGTAWLVYLSGNATQSGTWSTIQYGAQAASINVATIAGAGLTVQGTALAQNLPVTPLSASYVSTVTDRAQMFVWGTGAGTFTLPAAGTAGSGWYLQVKNSGSGDLVVAPPSGTIDGSANKIFHSATGDSATVFTDGVNYFTMGFGSENGISSPFGYITINVAGNTDVTLSGGQLNQISYKLTGVLTGNINLIVPTAVQQYWINNATTGAFSVTVKTSGGTGLVVAQGTSAILYCDGTNVVAGQTGGSFPITVPQGGTGATTAGAALTNLGGTGTGVSVFTAASASAARTALGSTTVGDSLFTAASASAALTTLNAPGLNLANVFTALNTFGVTSGPSAIFNSSSATGEYVTFQRSGTAIADIGNASVLFGGTLDDLGINARGTRGIIFGTNGAARGGISSNGNWSVSNVPSGVALTVALAAGYHGISVEGDGNSQFMMRLFSSSATSGRNGLQFLNTGAVTQNWVFGTDAGGTSTGSMQLRNVTAGTTPLQVDTTGFALSGAARTPPVSVAYGTTTTINCNLSNVFYTTFGAGNITTLTVSNPGDGQTINWKIKQDGTGSRTIAWPATFLWQGGSAPTLSTAANAEDLLVATYYVIPNRWYASLLKGMA